MFRIRKILDNTSAANRAAIDQVLQILEEQFPNVRSEELTKLPQQLNDPLKYKYRSILFIAENGTGKVYPVVNNLYATPVKPGDQDLYFLMMDGLGREVKIGRKLARKVVRAILERKYGDLISAAQIDEVVGSFRDDPLVLSKPRYVRKPVADKKTAFRDREFIALVVNEGHNIHHVKDRGYVEAPVRLTSILHELEKTHLFKRVQPRRVRDMLHRGGVV